MPKNLLRRLVWTARFKSVCMLIAISFILLSFYIALSRFNSTDPEPPVQPIDIATTRKFEAFTVHVETGLFIENFSQFDIIENEFEIDMIVWFRFNPTEITLDTIDKFSFENGRILHKSPPDIKAMDDKTFVKYNVTIEMKSDLEYYRFPLEDHKVSIVLTNHFVTPYEVTFEVLSTDFVVAPDVFIPNWKVKDLHTNFGIDENILNQIDTTKKIAFPKAVFSIDFVKSGIRKAFIIFAPIFIIFFFALFSFFLTLANTYGRTVLPATALTALLGYRFVIENLMPQVGYFTTTDYIYIILLVFSFLVFLSNMFITRLYNTATQSGSNTKQLFDRFSLTKDTMFIIITYLSALILGLTIMR